MRRSRFISLSNALDFAFAPSWSPTQSTNFSCSSARDSGRCMLPLAWTTGPLDSTLPPDFSLVVAILTPDQALAYLYEVEEDLAGPVGVIMKKHWSGLDATDRAYLVSSTLDAARALREQWQSQIGTIRWDLTAVYA